jgi:hypothetical protein
MQVFPESKHTSLNWIHDGILHACTLHFEGGKKSLHLEQCETCLFCQQKLKMPDKSPDMKIPDKISDISGFLVQH